MRFRELSLERYGRFEGCTLSFRPGEPDLHLVYGANEAGKSTTLAAVSDLLFGFPSQSSFNFRFDYPLLRVGAVLEEDGQVISCRRRKTKTQTLVDAEERPIDEAPLLSMLRGWTRERFHLGFSLNQVRLREGGRAIVDAKDDLGQALFAAGSGMTGIVSVLSALEAEADVIWGRKAAGRRLYTAAARQFDEGQKLLRERQLRPKTWTDARNAARRLEEELKAFQDQRLVLGTKRRRLERLRRIGPDVRRRVAVLQEIQEAAVTTILSRQSEAAAEAGLLARTAAERAGSAARTLIAESDKRAEALENDSSVLELEADIDALFLRRGAVLKAADDSPSLKAELAEKRGRLTRVREEIGSDAPVVSRVAMGRLRKVVQDHDKSVAAIFTLQTSFERARDRAAAIRDQLAGFQPAEHLPDLTAAVDSAVALGADVDERCAAAERKVKKLEALAKSAVDRLRPWSGSVGDLSGLPTISGPEIDAADTALRRSREGVLTERTAIEAIDAELEELARERVTLASGGDAVPASVLAGARASRDEIWAPLRDHLVLGQPHANPAVAAHDFEGALAEADTVADRRFLRAEASGRLAGVEDRAEGLAESRKLALARLQRWEEMESSVRREWDARLQCACLPLLDPRGLRGWCEARVAAQSDLDEVEGARQELEAELNRRAAPRSRLLAFLPSGTSAYTSDATLASVLAKASILRDKWKAEQNRADALVVELAGLDEQLLDADSKVSSAEDRRTDFVDKWAAECNALSLDLSIEAADTRLGLLDELRTLMDATEELDRRSRGIERDIRVFGEDVAALVERAGGLVEMDVGASLNALRVRVVKARDVNTVRGEIEASRRTHSEQLQAADANLAAALESLGPVMSEIGVSDVEAIALAIDVSKLARQRVEEVESLERRIAEAGDGYPVPELVAAFEAEDPDALSQSIAALDTDLTGLDARITTAATAAGAAREVADTLETGPGAAEVAADVEMARAEMDAQAESYLAKRAEAIVLRWAVERYRDRYQSPMLSRASELFRTLTLGRFVELRVDLESRPPRLLGLSEDRARLVAVEHMSEGTTDQLFLALRLAAMDQAVAAGVRLPFLADDLFVNFDDDRARAGLEVLAAMARSTQVLMLTHHTHIAQLARDVVGAELISECSFP